MLTAISEHIAQRLVRKPVVIVNRERRLMIESDLWKKYAY